MYLFSRLDVAAPNDVETPAHLMSDEEVNNLVAERRPAFVPLAGVGSQGNPNHFELILYLHEYR